jgi:hypothetical protein
MPSIKFGGSIGSVRDAKTGAVVSPRAFGSATVTGPEVEPLAKPAILRAIAEQLAASSSLVTAATMIDHAAVGAAASAAVGSPVTIDMLNVAFSEEDLAALRGQ